MFSYLTNLKNLQKLIFLCSFISISSLFSQAAPGDLDTTFDSDGKTTTDINSTKDTGQKVAIQSDGKIIVGGYSEGATNIFDFSLTRYNTDGTLDTTFGTNGKVQTVLSGWQQLNAIAIQSDGKIVAVGNGEGGASFATAQIHRYNADGSLDTTFGGGDGIVNDAIGIGSNLNDVVIQPDGKLVAVGHVSFGSVFNFLAVRYNSVGTLDTTFNVDGIYSSPIVGQLNSIAYSVAIQTDGKIIIGGDTNPGSGSWIRLNANGTPEGSASLDANSVRIRKIALQSDGKIIFGGIYSNSNEPNFNNIGVSRRNADKTIDTTFGISSGNGFANLGAESIGNAMLIQNDGRIVVGGYVSSTTRDFALVRFNSNGFLDVGFGNEGRITTPIGAGDDQINGLALQSDGKIVAAGTSFNGINNDFAAARYLSGNSSTVANSTAFDFDGDGKADSAVFRAGNWYILQSLNNSFKAISFGQTGDVIVPADFDGDGRSDTAVFRSLNANWYIQRSSDGGFVAEQFGTGDSLPRPGDFDGDGKADIAVFYPANGYWYIKQSQSRNTRIVNFGTNGDTPLIANFDGDNKDDIAVFRASTGSWYWLKSSDNSFNAAQFGANDDLPTVADFDGDGKSDFSVFRPSNGNWYQQRSTNGFAAINFGISSDRPVAADYDGDGKADIGVFRNGNWYELLSSSNGFVGVSWGQSGDSAVASAFIP